MDGWQTAAGLELMVVPWLSDGCRIAFRLQQWSCWISESCSIVTTCLADVAMWGMDIIMLVTYWDIPLLISTNVMTSWTRRHSYVEDLTGERESWVGQGTHIIGSYLKLEARFQWEASATNSWEAHIAVRLAHYFMWLFSFFLLFWWPQSFPSRPCSSRLCPLHYHHHLPPPPSPRPYSCLLSSPHQICMCLHMSSSTSGWLLQADAYTYKIHVCPSKSGCAIHLLHLQFPFWWWYVFGWIRAWSLLMRSVWPEAEWCGKEILLHAIPTSETFLWGWIWFHNRHVSSYPTRSQ